MLPLAKQDDGGTAPDSDLSDRLRQLLRTCDLRTTTATALSRALEAEFGVDLSDRRAFIRRRIELFLDGRGDEITPENDGVDDVHGEAIEWKKAESVVTYDDERTGCEEDGEEGEERSGKRRSKGRLGFIVFYVLFSFLFFSFRLVAEKRKESGRLSLFF